MMPSKKRLGKWYQEKLMELTVQDTWITLIIPMVGHNVVFRISLHMPIVMVMTTVLPLLRMVTMGITRTIKKMRTQVTIMTKFVSILSSQPKIGAKKFLGNLVVAKALLGMARMKKASTETTKSTILNAVNLLVPMSWNAKTNIKTAGMEDTFRLEMTKHNIAKILREKAKSTR